MAIKFTEDQDTLKKKLEAKLKKLKLKKPVIPTQKKVKKAMSKKATKPLGDVKDMLKDELEIGIYRDVLKERGTNENKIPSNKAPILSPKEFASMTDDEITRYRKYKAIEENPGVAPLIDSGPKGNPIRDGLDVARYLDSKGNRDPPPTIAEKVTEIKALKEIIGDGKDSSRDELYKIILNSQREQAKENAEIMKQVHEAEKEIFRDKYNALAKKLNEIEQKGNVDPLAYLHGEKERAKSIRELFTDDEIKPGKSDIDSQIKLKLIEQDFTLKTMALEDKRRHQDLEQSKSNEMTGIIKEGIKSFSENISKVLGEVLGSIGKEQLKSMALPPTVSLNSIEQPQMRPQQQPQMRPQQQPQMRPQQQPQKRKDKRMSGFNVIESD